MNVIRYLCEYLLTRGYPASVRESLKYHWQNTVRARLESESSELFIEKRLILSNTKIRFRWSDDNRHLYDDNGALWIESVAPDWRRGWHSQIGNKIVAELLSDFFYFLTQYIHRCNTTPIVTYIAYKYKVDPTWLYSPKTSHYYSDATDFSKNKIQHNPKLTAFLNQVDCHEPAVHNACFHYLKALRLVDLGYFEEAFVNMECVSSLLRQRNMQMHGNDAAYSDIGISIQQEKMIKSLHNLRNSFAAHPSGTKWWDFAEIFGSKVNQFLDLTVSLLLKLAASYQKASSVKYTFVGISNAPDNFFDAFWFNRIPI
jgi:hypothetical protein